MSLKEQVMFKISILIAAVAVLLAMPWSASAEDNGPKEAKTTAEILKAVQKIHVGMAIGGKPEQVITAEFNRSDIVDIKAFVVWHSPFSGFPGCCAYLYLFDAEKKVWVREMSKTFRGTANNYVSVEFGDKVILRNEDGKVVYKYSFWASAVDPNPIKEKVSISSGEEFFIEFNRDGDRLTNPSKAKKAEVKKLSVNVKLGVTTASPVAPPREGATRPFLTVENNFEKTLHFRALVRMKGSKEFFEVDENMEPLPAGDTFNKCWEFDSLVEEVILYEFKLSDKRPE
jgi:hypothetical protein